jgi:hypothetical protein
MARGACPERLTLKGDPATRFAHSDKKVLTGRYWERSHAACRAECANITGEFDI